MKWEPIETAPKEGVFLVWLPKPELDSHVVPMKRTPRVSLIASRFAFDFDNNKPTHWMPLPEPPK